MIMKRKDKITVFKTVETLYDAAAKLCLAIAEKSILARGRFVICLSGGDTPKGLYSLLATHPYHDLFPWKDTYVFWGDERCVPLTDNQNNAYMAQKLLLEKIDLPSTNIFPIPVNLPPAEAALEYEKTMKLFFGTDTPSFDLLLLGIGNDGHTASLFPGTEVLNEKRRWVKEVYVTEQQMYRITLTAHLINKAHHVLFLVSGASKAEVLQTILTAPFQPEKYPAQLIQPEHGDIYWYVDLEAAAKILNLSNRLRKYHF